MQWIQILEVILGNIPGIIPFNLTRKRNEMVSSSNFNLPIAL